MLNKQTDLDRLFQALSDSTRRAMVERLRQGPCSVSELARPLPMSLPAAMQHLQILEDAGVVVSEKSGRVRTCRMTPSALADAEQWLNACRVEWEQRLDRLGDYLATLKKDGDKNDGPA